MPCYSLLLAVLLGAGETSVVFKDRTADLGLNAGSNNACWADLDNDGWTDLCVGAAVWKNNAGKGFTKTESMGPCVAADFDNDGFVDLFYFTALRLYRNEGGKSFSLVKLPDLPPTVCLGACWGDFNGDGFVDLYVGGYEDWDKNITFTSFVLMNDHGKSFQLGQTDNRYRARGVTACDFDSDGDMDVYVSNYRLQPNLLWRNDGAGKFQDAAADLGAVATSEGFRGGHSIGAAWGDFDNDGLFDLFAGNFAHQDDRGNQPQSRFLRNLGREKGHKFEDRGICGVFYQESYASPAAGDYDNDGDLDLFFTTVYGVASFGRPNFPVLFENGGDWTFKDVTAAAQVAGLGPTYQAAWADYDNDGDLDLVSGSKLFENQSSGQHWLKVHLAGDGATVNRSAVAAQARITLDGKTLTRQVEAGTGEGNQNDLTLHFGLGSHAGPVNVEVLWPNGAKQRLENVETGRVLTVTFAEP